MTQTGSGEAGPAPGASQRAAGAGLAGPRPRSRPACAGWTRRAFRTDPEVVLFAARVSVWMRWFVGLVAVFELGYRPGFWLAADREYLFIVLLVPFVIFNGLVHYRLHRTPDGDVALAALPQRHGRGAHHRYP